MTHTMNCGIMSGRACDCTHPIDRRCPAGRPCQLCGRGFVIYRKPPRAPVYFKTVAEHDQSLADGALRCIMQLSERTRGRNPAVSHMLNALEEAMVKIREELKE